MFAALTAGKVRGEYPLAVPGGLAFAGFEGYGPWRLVSVSQNGRLAAILANPPMTDGLRSGVPGKGKPFPDGSKMAKVHPMPDRGIRRAHKC